MSRGGSSVVSGPKRNLTRLTREGPDDSLGKGASKSLPSVSVCSFGSKRPTHLPLEPLRLGSYRPWSPLTPVRNL